MQKETVEINKIKEVLVLKDIFSEAKHVCVSFPIKFQVSSIILTSFRQRVILIGNRIGIGNLGNHDWCKCGYCKKQVREIDFLFSREVDAMLLLFWL